MNKSKRILVSKQDRKSKKLDLSHDELTQAIRRFTERGGLIKELPPERTGYRPVVGNHMGSAYETVIER